MATTVCVLIGNSDNRLTQKNINYASFLSGIREIFYRLKWNTNGGDD